MLKVLFLLQLFFSSIREFTTTNTENALPAAPYPIRRRDVSIHRVLQKYSGKLIACTSAF